MESFGDKEAVANSDDDDDEGLTIIVDSPKSKRNNCTEISADEAEILSDIGRDLELSIQEKAAKTNLKNADVKKILKQVVTNEHVLAYVRQSENPEQEIQLDFEPKLTRAKAKELFSTLVSPNTSKKSKTQVLIGEELPEDESSGDEYIPGDEESDDDTVQSEDANDLSITEPSTPQSTECGTQTTWTDDGVFKIPEAKNLEENEKLNIALRTRSKLSLSDTPLEVIEEAFIPPDITTDMYDMECDDDDWKNFLKEFTRPLDEINIGHEDEDHDPEYNILADEEIDNVDEEELRADKGVKVTRKELNNLIAELFDYADHFNAVTGQLNVPLSPKLENTQSEQQVTQENAEQPQFEITLLESNYIKISEEQKMLLDQQMRQYVQIVTQNLLLTYNHPEYHDMSEKCYNSLLDLQDRSNGNIFSHFSPINLPQAIELVDHWKERLTHKTNDKSVRDHNDHVKRIISETIQAQSAGVFYVPKFSNLYLDVVSKSSVFIYPMLLPRIPFKPSKALKRHFFMESELELLALGLEQFIPFLKTDPFHLKSDGNVKIKDVCYYINKYMMPPKEPQKLINHLKMARHSVDTNPVKYFYNHNETRKIIHYIHPLDCFKVVPPCEREYDQLPQLWKEYIYPNFNKFRSTFGPYPILPKSETLITLTPLPLYSITKVNKSPAFNKNFSKKVKPPLKRKEKKVRSTQKRRNYFTNSIARTEINSNSSLGLNNTNSSIEGEFSSKSNTLNSLRNRVTSTPVKSRRSLDSYFQAPLKNVSITNDEVLGLKFNSSIFGRLSSKGGTFPSMPTLMTSVKKNKDGEGAMNVEECASTSMLNETKVEDNQDFNNRDSEENEVISSRKGNVADDEDFKEKTDSAVNAGDTFECIEGGDVHENIANESGEREQNIDEDIEPEKDNLDEINALMVASSTITSSVKKKPTCAEKKKARLRREFKSNLRMLSEEADEAISEKTDRFVQAYFDKIKERLDLDEYHQIMEILTNFDKSKDDTTQLFKSVEAVIGKKYPDILDEFLCFFTDVQAKNIGKWFPYIIINKMSMFLKKLELFFKDQPSQVKRIYRCLSELTATENVSMSVVKNSLLPLLKGNSLLVDMFLQIFPKEKPPDSLFNSGPWEYVQVGKDKSSKVEDCYESITIPEAEDPYGGANCICPCHTSSEDAGYKSRSMHCVDCGTKFMQGRLYVQTGKGLRIAKITFEDTSVDHFTRLSCPLKMKRHDSSPFKNITHTNDEPKLSSDEEPDKKQQKLIKGTKRKRNTKKKTPEVKAECAKPQVETIVAPSVEIEAKKDCLGDQNNENTSDSSLNEVKQQTEENMEWDCNTSIESIELKASPEHVSAESESEFCEETSQDNTDSEGCSEGGDSETNSPDGSSQWDRSEDKIILETFQRVEDREAAFKSIAEKLEHRTMGQIQQRFELLINLLKKLSKDS